MINKTKGSIASCQVGYSRKNDLKAYIIANKISKHKNRYFYKRTQKASQICSEEQLLFFKKERAFTYAQFMRQDGMILEVYVPETAIIGRLDKLTIKPKNIDKSKICKFFPNLMNQEYYIANDKFSI